jgi:DNA-binding response OmpR family regulator
MKILLVSESIELYKYTIGMIEQDIKLERIGFEQLEYVNMVEADIVILDFVYNMVKGGIFNSIIVIRGKSCAYVPILVIMEGGTIQDIFEVLSIGALDYIEKERLVFDYEQKIRSMINWKWYYGLESMISAAEK